MLAITPIPQLTLDARGIKEKKPMGYINDLERELNKRLSDLEEERRKKLIRFIKLCVLESYRNGLNQAEKEKQGQRRS